MMAFKAFYREDLRQTLVAVCVAMLSAAVANGGGNVEYARGVLDVTRANGLNYGFSWLDLRTEVAAALVDAGRTDVLDAVLGGQLVTT
jgi:hypothetical protein